MTTCSSDRQENRCPSFGSTETVEVEPLSSFRFKLRSSGGGPHIVDGFPPQGIQVQAWKRRFVVTRYIILSSSSSSSSMMLILAERPGTSTASRNSAETLLHAAFARKMSVWKGLRKVLGPWRDPQIRPSL